MKIVFILFNVIYVYGAEAYYSIPHAEWSENTICQHMVEWEIYHQNCMVQCCKLIHVCRLYEAD